jgi:hypothetical protein
MLRLSEAAWGHQRGRARLAIALAALVLSAVTVRLVERPVRFNPSLVRRPMRSLAVGLAITVGVLAVGGVVTTLATRFSQRGAQARFTRVAAPPPLYRDGCGVDVFGTATPSRCVYGARNSSATVALFGDSHSGAWFPAVERLAVANGMKLLPFVKAACPSADVSMDSVQLARPYSECDQWRAHSLATIEQVHPSLVIVSNDTTFVSENPANWEVTPAQWEAGMRRTLTSLARSGARVVVISDIPHALRDGNVCLARQAWNPFFRGTCTFHLSASLNPPAQRAEANAVAAAPGARIVSLNDAICNVPVCPVERDGMVLYEDAGHLTAEFSASLGPLLIERTADATGRQ